MEESKKSPPKRREKGSDYKYGGIFPNYLPILDEFEDMLEWKVVNGKKIPEPKHGIFEEFDNLNSNIDKIKD